MFQIHLCLYLSPRGWAVLLHCKVKGIHSLHVRKPTFHIELHKSHRNKRLEGVREYTVLYLEHLGNGLKLETLAVCFFAGRLATLALPPLSPPPLLPVFSWLGCSLPRDCASTRHLLWPQVSHCVGPCLLPLLLPVPASAAPGRLDRVSPCPLCPLLLVRALWGVNGWWRQVLKLVPECFSSVCSPGLTCADGCAVAVSLFPPHTLGIAPARRRRQWQKIYGKASWLSKHGLLSPPRLIQMLCQTQTLLAIFSKFPSCLLPQARAVQACTRHRVWAVLESMRLSQTEP